ncbi:MAG: hypothetical protein WC781_04860 [Candidatus Pacearchaeota archaeon]|jgi:hypothetical protein
MNMWIIGAIIVGLVLVAGTMVIAAEQNNNTTPVTQKSCGGCNGKCTAESNCGLATCGAANGKTCGCGK